MDDAEDYGRQLTLLTCARAARFSEWLDDQTHRNGEWLQIPPKSALAMADRRTAPYQMSHVAVAMLNDSLEHLHTLDAIFQKVGVLPRVTPFTLLRGGMESAASLFWMLEPRKARARIARHFALWEQSNHHRAQAARTVGFEHGPTELQAAHSEHMSEFLADDRLSPHPKRTDILRRIDETLGNGSSALWFWQICSGFAHGQEWAAHLFQQYERERPTSSPGVSHYRVTSKWMVVALCASTVHELVAASLHCLDKLTTDNGLRRNNLAAAYARVVDAREFIAPEIVAEIYARHGVPILPEE